MLKFFLNFFADLESILYDKTKLPGFFFFNFSLIFYNQFTINWKRFKKSSFFGSKYLVSMDAL